MTNLEREMQEVDAFILSDQQEASIDYALAHARDPDDDEVAITARFDVENRILLVELKTGQQLAVPQNDSQDIANADPRDLADIEILGSGTALHFEKVMAGVHVDALRRGHLWQ